MNINDFRSALKFGGARSSKFKVRITNPVSAIADLKIPLMCEAAAMPESTINPIETFYFGRAIKLAANRTFADWNTVIINDEDFSIKNALETWHNAINSLEGNKANSSFATPAAYKSTAEITQYSQDGRELRTYKMVGIWPVNIAAQEMSWQDEQIEKFAVTWAYDYWFVSDNNTGNAGGK